MPMKSSILNKKETIPHGTPISASARRGMTLIEILVVVGIMMVIMAVSVPVLAPVAESRVGRECARGVQSALESARARAIRLGRPCGVALIPFHDEYKYACISVEQLTAPPSVTTTYSLSGSSITVNTGNLPTLKRGDSVQLNFAGPRFIVTNQSGNTLNDQAWYDSIDEEHLYYDFRQYGSDTDRYCTVNYFPVSEVNNAFAKALGIESAYTLPKGYIVDLFYSGYSTEQLSSVLEGVSGTNIRKFPPSVVFNPDGSAALYISGTKVELDTETDPRIYLLVGSWERMIYGGKTLAEDDHSNMQSPDAFWVVVNPRTGMVTTAANNAFSGTSSNRVQNVTDARYNARERVLKGGN